MKRLGNRSLTRTAVILGAGFSKAAGLPTTDELSSHFLTLGPTRATADRMQARITKHLRAFWEEVFSSRGASEWPSFEDHFTALDLAANTGHNLGPRYPPAKLRALRRLSIHRIFDVLDMFADRAIRQPTPERRAVEAFIAECASDPTNTIITTNWDVVVETILTRRGIPFQYGVPVHSHPGYAWELTGIPVLKLQGSANWSYCDSCQRLFADRHPGKTLLHQWAFLEDRDFMALEEGGFAGPIPHSNHECPYCFIRMSARVATFSYSKAYEYSQFHVSWDCALQRLRDAQNWIFIGYSLPEADFELRQLIKVAQLGSNRRNRRIILVTKDDYEAFDRFDRFFGDALTGLEFRGFEAFYRDLR